MAFFQFSCPYCSGQFAVENPPAGQAVACPSCGGQVALPADLPPPVGEPRSAARNPPVADERVVSNTPFDFLEVSPPPVPRSHQPKQSALPSQVRRLSRQERERRRARRNLVMMAAGILVLSIAALVLSRL